MKTNFTPKLIAIAMIALSFLACNDDDKKEEKPKNQFTVDGVATAITTAAFIYDTQESISDVDGNPYYRHELVFLPATATMEGTLAHGTGDIVGLLINGSTGDLDVGTYVFTGKEANAKAFEVWRATLNLNFDYNDGNQTYDENLFTSGELKISKSGEIYTIDFDGVAEGKAVKVHYSGAIMEISGD